MGFYLKILSAVVAVSALFFAFSEESCAQGAAAGGGGEIAQQTCDTQVWQTMTRRAHIEAEREIMQNQNLIFKPDSVLVYSCFDNMAAHASLFVGQLFTHTTYWNKKEIIPWGGQFGMDTAMQKVVIDSMKPYIEGSFQYAMLGGRGDAITGNDQGGGNLSVKLPRDIGDKGRKYECKQMNDVWKAAKCLNFIHNDKFSPTDGFYPFIGLEPTEGGQRIQGYDEIKEVRKWPDNLKCGDDTGKPIYDMEGWEDAYRESRNEDEGFGDTNNLYQFGNPLTQTFKDVRKKLEPAKCQEGGAILTGVQVLEAPSGNPSPYPDGVCTNPGCVYQKGGGQQGTCVAVGG